MTVIPTEVLLTRLVAGDREAENEVIERVQSELRGMARIIERRHPLPSDVPAEDIVHNAIMRALRGGSMQARTRQGFLAYLRIIADNEAKDVIRRARAKKRGGAYARIPVDDNSMPGRDRSPSSLARIVERDRRVHDAIKQLDDLDQFLIYERWFGGRAVDDLAQELWSKEADNAWDPKAEACARFYQRIKRRLPRAVKRIGELCGDES